MKKIAVLSLIIAGLMGDAFGAAARATARGNARGGTSGTSAQNAAAPKTSGTTSARAAARTGAAAAPKTTTAAKTGGTTSARAAVRGGTTAANTSGAKTSGAPVVSARAAKTQKVVGSGTKVAAAAQNVVVSEECRAKFEGCMDSFCMLDNDTGGRCLCSDKNAEYDAILAEIEKLDQQSYQMATFGVERLEMGEDADAAIASANAAAMSVLDGMTKNEREKNTTSARKSLDLSLWDAPIELEDEDVFGENATFEDLSDTEGDDLYRAAAEICTAQITDCDKDLNMLRMMYSQRIKSDCTAYENSLKQQKTASQQKLAAAEKALRETALDQLRTANKYDLGQCTIEFKKCMQTTAGCGNDFSSCAVMAALDATNTRKSTSKGAKNYQIQGAATTIEISASTYDMLMSKKPLCESVTKSCVKVANQVWDTFLKEVAPQLKSAELIAEDNARQNCIGNISNCFQKACKDNMDPNDPDGSYDMCLSRPETMLNVCKVPLNNCGISANSPEEAAKSNVWDFVLARLAAMRVDSCTKEVKDCLIADDRCGEDYKNCIGLDTDAIIRMCPQEKLTGCYTTGKTTDEVDDYIARVAQGIMLNIDNNFLKQCQKALDESMSLVCGSLENCDAMAVDTGIGTRSLSYKFCEFDVSDSTFTGKNCKSDVAQVSDAEIRKALEAGSKMTFSSKIDGQIPWSKVSFLGADGNIDSAFFENNGLAALGADEASKAELEALRNNINAAIRTIESDPTVQYCMTGREVQGMKKFTTDEDGNTTSTRGKIGDKSDGGARFPQLTQQVKAIIAASAIKKAQENYNQKMDEFNERSGQDLVKFGERMAEVSKQVAKEQRAEMARIACVYYGDQSTLLKMQRYWLDRYTHERVENENGAQYAGSQVEENPYDQNEDKRYVGVSKTEEPYYKETVTSTFNPETLVCQRCLRAQNCTNQKGYYDGVRVDSRYCKGWSDPVETCSEVQM